MIEFILSILKAVAGKIVTDEFNATCPSLAQWLIKRSAAKLGVHRERYEEEWLADLADRGTPIRKLLFAIGICRAAVTLGRELGPSAKAIQPKPRFSIRSGKFTDLFTSYEDLGPSDQLEERPSRASLIDFVRTRLLAFFHDYSQVLTVLSIMIVAVAVVACAIRIFMKIVIGW